MKISLREVRKKRHNKKHRPSSNHLATVKLVELIVAGVVTGLVGWVELKVE